MLALPPGAGASRCFSCAVLTYVRPAFAWFQELAHNWPAIAFIEGESPMWKDRLTMRLVLVAIFFISVHGVASAQATRTWVSGVGDDANPCSRTAPCKTFAGAISKTAAGGEISVLDPGGFGGVTITKSITINNVGGEAGVLVSGTNAIVINAAATDRVTLRGLTIEGLGTGLAGIRVLSAAEVIVDDCQVQGFRGANSSGILLAPSSGTSRLTVRNSAINANGQATAGSAGITVKPTSTATAIADINNTHLANNGTGLYTDSSATTGSVFVTISNSQIVGNTLDGVLVKATATGNHKVAVENNTIANNAFTPPVAAGVRADGAAATVRIYNNIITFNRIGVKLDNSGVINSYGGNIINGNYDNGTFTSTQATQ
jgi:Right handed beta helix region